VALSILGVELTLRKLCHLKEPTTGPVDRRCLARAGYNATIDTPLGWINRALPLSECDPMASTLPACEHCPPKGWLIL